MKKTRFLWALAAVAGAGALLYWPELHVGLVLANLGLHALVLGCQLVATRAARPSSPPLDRLEEEPFVSVLVPAHNEPPEVLRETLRSLARLRWSAHEVVVIDNNTADEALWRPIERLCRELGPRFRFFHFEGVRGAKAGALNLILPEIDDRAKFVFVVDADYVVERDALRRAVFRATLPRIGLVQFPQEYRNLGPGNAGIALDYRHFFSGYMNLAQQLGAVPSTGTLSLIRVDALRSVGGFNPGVVTEDADLGLRLNAAGWRSVYVNEVIGRGLIPHDLESLKKQRWRWAFGNAQILKLNWRRLLFGAELHGRQKLGYLLHLTAWFNFNLIPSLSLILMAPAALLGRMHPLQPYIVVASGFTLTTFLVLRFGTLFYSLRHDGHRLPVIWSAFLSHLGLGWVFSASWMKCLWNHRAPFVRTNKFLHQRLPGVLRTTLVEAGLGVLLLAACLILAAADFVIGPVAALAMAGARFLVYWVEWQMRHTRRVTETLARETHARWRFVPGTATPPTATRVT